MIQTRRVAAILTALSLTVAACSHPSGQQYTGEDVGRIVDTAEATVISARPVDIKGGENRGIGAVAGGAAAGSVAAAAVDNPGAEAAATIIAALAGAGLGWLIEEDARSRKGIEYVLRTADGRVITLVQNRGPDEEPIAKGNEVLIQYGRAYTRVVPLPAGAGGTGEARDDGQDHNGLATGRGVAPKTQSATGDESAPDGDGGGDRNRSGSWGDPDGE
jgi:outer membrane lipoprotein SlyB